MANEFEEIGHSGGKITFRITTDQQGRRGFQVTISENRPVPAVWIAVYASGDHSPWCGNGKGILTRAAVGEQIEFIGFT